MNNNNKQSCSQLLVTLQCCHSILNTAWPKPGVTQMQGAQIYIGTKLFEALENALSQVERDVFACRIFSPNDIPYNVCELFEVMIKRLNKIGRKTNNSQIDNAVNLLYLATGVLYHHICKLFNVIPEQDDRFSPVEELQPLLISCGWDTKTCDTQIILEMLSKKMSKCLSGLIEPMEE